jgi:ArsR family transcriptional regulator
MRGKKSVGEIATLVKVSQPVASQHLKILKENDLVLDQKIGKEVYYEINAEHTLKLLTALVSDIQKKK